MTRRSCGSSFEKLPKPHHREGIEFAVFEELHFDFFFSLRTCFCSHGFEESYLRCLTVLYAIKGFVGEIRANCREDGLDAPASVLGRMIVATSRDREEIDDPVDDC
jgi:hypothetical protein